MVVYPIMSSPKKVIKVIKVIKKNSTPNIYVRSMYMHVTEEHLIVSDIGRFANNLK
jgi:hypothetical protein